MFDSAGDNSSCPNNAELKNGKRAARALAGTTPESVDEAAQTQGIQLTEEGLAAPHF
jgi:hypothetical protein